MANAAKHLFLAALLFAQVGVCSAEQTASELFVVFTLKEPAIVKSAEKYLDGLEEGFVLANAEIRRRRGKELYCQPRDLVLTNDQRLDMMKREVVKDQGLLLRSAGAVFLLSLQKVFPCRWAIAAPHMSTPPDRSKLKA